jgi:uncharacterized phage protein (TIGR01671 family)
MIPRFRVWDVELKSMKEVMDIDYRLECVELSDSDGDTYIQGFSNIKLMQSTGLRDKSEREIFEGDILKVTNLSSWLEVVSFNKNKAMFVSKETKREVEETPLYDLFNTDIFEIEIIGNIHTNPELAEVSS